MMGYDRSTEHGISGRLRFYASDPADRDCIRRAIDVGARVVLDSLRELELCEEEAASLSTVSAAVSVR